MCRWAAWIGAQIFMEEVISQPKHSLIEQSQRAEETKTSINADGFGVAWYDHRAEPGLYRDVHPAWSDSNLAAIARQVKSRLFLVHVRASTGSAISRNNCHPFAVGKWSFMHNGQVGGFDQFRKQADMGIADHLYDQRRGATDSEAIFLHALGHGLDADPMAALARAVAAFQRLSMAQGRAPHMRLSAALSDGKRLFAVRYASDSRAPSLYFRYCPDRSGHMIVSEPLEATGADWQAVPPNCAMCFADGTVTTQAFLNSANQLVA